MKRIIYLSFFCLFLHINLGNAQPKNTLPVTTQIISWTYPDSITKLNPAHYASMKNKCGDVSIDIPKNAYTQASFLNIKLNKNKKRTTGWWLNGNIQIQLDCKLTDIQSTEKKYHMTYDPKTQIWAYKEDPSDQQDDDTSDQGFTMDKDIVDFYPLKAQNSNGWYQIITQQIPYYKGGQSKGHDYNSNLFFCLMETKGSRLLCGSGLVRYIPSKKYINSKNDNYIPMLLGFLKSIKFEDKK